MSEAFANKNFYERLNVPRDATKKHITKAFREIASVYHPDAGMYDEAGGDLGRAHLDIYVLITEAYNTLNDVGRREAYDRKLGPASASSRPKLEKKNTEEWQNVDRFDEADQLKSQAQREKFQVRDSAFEDGGEIKSSIDIGSLGQRTSVLRSAIYGGTVSDLGREELNAIVDEEEEEEIEEEYEESYPEDEDDDSDYVPLSERIRDCFDFRRPIVPLLGGLVFGVIFCLLIAFLLF